MTNWLQGGGEMGERVRHHDWATTPLGPLDQWPDVLKTTVALCLASSFPQAIVWGPSLITLYNDGFIPILGDKPDALGRPFSEIWQEAWPEISPIANAAFAGEATFIENFPLRVERGGAPEQAYFTFCYSPIRDVQGNVVGMLDTVTETTATVVLSRRLAELNASLEQRVNERTTLLTQTEAALRQSQKLEAIGQLTGGVAHDFNNLLTIIRSSVDFLRMPALSEERRQRYMSAVSDTVERAGKLTSQLLAFARRQPLNPEVFDAGQRVNNIGEMLETVTGARIKVRVELPGLPCYIRADSSQFETALINIALNARDAMNGQGTLTLSVVADQALPSIRGDAGSRQAFIAISLTDTGSGIPGETFERIFEPFFTTKEVGKGTGLGLSQVFGFAKQSGGNVDVASKVGQGTVFTLYLPQVVPEEGVENPAQEVCGLVAESAQRHILVVEDNLEVGRFANQILQDLGYQTTWATNAEQALELAGADAMGFDAVFSDVVMPGITGVALARELRRRRPGLPVVLTSGYSEELAESGYEGLVFLPKPYSADQVSQVLARALFKG
ncbi:ATP-binding protein [Pseudomonas sp. PAMC 25886]|jgi:signal transduction histidine kinase/CheY-like chemotaxis protein|uniref:ATP-binding protein n=1 Tax=Pseudomonas sp. PAMC 25886 TaxID=1125977 RepID=UPI000288502C|nr:ATP-binding protein [Pseudomonas sp. PAMC 25886]